MLALLILISLNDFDTEKRFLSYFIGYLVKTI